MYKIPGLKYRYYANKDCEALEYKGLFVKFSIAKDCLGTQICYNGRFFHNKSFKGIDDGYQYLLKNYKEAIKFFRKEWINNKKPTWHRTKRIFWKIAKRLGIKLPYPGFNHLSEDIKLVLERINK